MEAPGPVLNPFADHEAGGQIMKRSLYWHGVWPCFMLKGRFENIVPPVIYSGPGIPQAS